MTVAHISDTAFLTALARAVETDRPDRLIDDPLAWRLLGDRAPAFAALRAQAPAEFRSVALRSRLLDDLLLETLAAVGADTVLNLACGLDARPYRLSLPPELRWVEVDLPGMIAHKDSLLAGVPARCQVERHALDLADIDARRALFTSLGGRTVVVSEGLLLYLTPNDVTTLAADLHAAPGVTAWLTDLMTPLATWYFPESWRKHMNAARAPIQFAPEAGPAFFAPLGWKPASFHSFSDAMARLLPDAPTTARWLRLLAGMPEDEQADVRAMLGCARLDRTPS